MSLTIGQKCVRVLYLLRGLGNPRAVGPLTPYGFSAEVRKEGWRLLIAASDTKLEGTVYTPPDPTVFEALDAWENHWFPIIRVCMQRHYPKVGAKLFVNLRQTKGLEAAVSVATMVRRIRTAQRDGSEEEQAAMVVLAERGLTEAELVKAEELMAKFETTPEPLPPEPDQADRTAAEKEMWDWYLEWSTVARQAIRDRNVLRSLGFLRPSRGNDAPEVELDDELGVDEISEAEAETRPAVTESATN